MATAKKGGGRRRSSKRRRDLLSLGLLTAVLLVCGVITLGEYLDVSWLPSWDAILQQEELQPTVTTSGGEPLEGEVQVHYLDVGQADSILITTPDKTILIDAGNEGCGPGIQQYLESQEVDSIDFLIATHAHADHIGDMDYVVENFSIGQIIMPRLSEEMVPTTRVYQNLLNAISDKGKKIQAASPGASYAICEGGLLEILAPNRDYDDLNNTSVVCRLTYGETSFLFTGDAEETSEKDILDAGFDVSADVYKAGHHGSSTSNSLAYLKAVDPQYAVISCGEGNDYGHPHSEVLERFDKLGIQVLRTDLMGTVVVASDGRELQVATQKAA